MAFRISGLAPDPFRHLYGQPDSVLRAHGVERRRVDTFPGYPDRIELRDVPVGDTVLLLNHTHQPADTPYRASHAIFVREHATAAAEFIDEVPDLLRRRLLSVRAFDGRHHMIDADVVDGTQLEALIDRLFASEHAAYLHVHLAKRGCYAARIDLA